MITLVKIKNPVEYSFLDWLKFRDDHLHNKEKFVLFTRNVCAFSAKKWKNTDFVRNKILKKIPTFDQNKLRDLMIIFDYLIDFYTSKPMPRCWYIDNATARKGFYIERGVNKGKIYTKELPMPYNHQTVRDFA